ncbi:MAG: hypothetical protein C4583_08065 [Anaerolineaceae bacterium]|nr:MAG: hypothetical protein C4583_08065 [Anaerolineaceae bacterium]
MPIDLNILSLYRINGQVQSTLPGLAAFVPPRKAARGRERETLLVSLLLNGNVPFLNEEYEKLTGDVAAAYYNTHGALTTALRAAAASVNQALLERNLSTSGRGQYVIGWLTLVALRESQLTILQCGPTHVLSFSGGATRHLHDPALSGKGLGLGQSISQFYSQIQFQAGDRLLLCSKLPPAWNDAFGSDRGLPAPESTRKRLMAIAEGDVSGALIHVTEGAGEIVFSVDASPPLSAPARVDLPAAFIPPEPPDETPPVAHVIGQPPTEQPSAYAIPPQPVEADEALVEQLANVAMARQFPPSIPRATLPEPEPDMESIPEAEEPEFETVDVTSAPRRSPEESALRRAETQRQAARAAVTGIAAWRRVTERVGAALRKFLPNLLPGGESDISLPVPAMAFISILIPLLVVTIAVVVYMRFGRSSQYDTYIAQAQVLREQAMSETDPIRQREAWNNVLQRVAQAETYNVTSETLALRQEAQARLDALLGITRLNFSPIFSGGLSAEVSRMAASDSDLYMLDAAQGSILRAVIGRGYEMDVTFDCRPGLYGNNSVGSLLDLLVLPRVNTLNSSVMGIDVAGNLLYCAPGQVAKAFALTPPSTNWGRVTAMTLDNGKLYVLDAPARAVWIYAEKDGVFTDAPLFFFGNQIPEMQDAIDIAVSGDELYLLHADGHLTHCTYSRIDGVPTRCESPVKLVNRFPAYGEMDMFAEAHFTQMFLTGLPDSLLLLLNADGQSVVRLGSHGFELQGIWSAPVDFFPVGPLSAMTFSPGHNLYLALGNQVYVANNAP